MDRTDVILAAIRKQLMDRKASIDAADDLGEVEITVKLTAGTSHVRSVSYSEERVNRRSTVDYRAPAARS